MPGLKLAQIFAAMSTAQARAPQRRATPRQTLAALLGLLIGYPLFASAGYWLFPLFSGHGSDRSMEAELAAVFAIGPLGAVVGLVVGMIVGGRKLVGETPPATDDI
jgi:hypothetical protein